MKALCWNGVNDLRVETVPDSRILAPHDAIVRVRLSSACGSDLHLLDGYVPTMRAGDIIGHEFIGDVVETGPEVETLAVGDRVIVISITGAGRTIASRPSGWKPTAPASTTGTIAPSRLCGSRPAVPRRCGRRSSAVGRAARFP